MTVRLRVATPSDLPAIREIYAPFVENTAILFAYDPPSVADLETRLEQKTDYPWLACRLNGEVAGYAYADAIREYITCRWTVETSIYVHPEFQRHGVARDLYTALLNLPERQGYISAVAVITTPDPTSIASHGSFGFERVGRFEHTDYKSDTWHDVGWRSFDLDNRPGDPDASLSVADTRDRDWWDGTLAHGAALVENNA